MTKEANPIRTASSPTFVGLAPAIPAAANAATATGGVIAEIIEKYTINRWAANGLTPRPINAGAANMAVRTYAAATGIPIPKTIHIIIIKINEGNNFPAVIFKIMLFNFPPKPVVMIPATTKPAAPHAVLIGIADLAPSAIASMIFRKFNFVLLVNQLMTIIASIPYTPVLDGLYPCNKKTTKTVTGIKWNHPSFKTFFTLGISSTFILGKSRRSASK